MTVKVADPRIYAGVTARPISKDERARIKANPPKGGSVLREGRKPPAQSKAKHDPEAC